MILVLENDKSTCEALSMALREYCDKQADCVYTIKEALGKLKENTYELILVDYLLDDGVADRFLEVYTKYAKQTPVVLMSASTIAHLVADKYHIPLLKKPFELDTLLAFCR